MANQYASSITSPTPPAVTAPRIAPLPVVVYAASSELTHPWLLVNELFRDIARGRELGWRLFLRNLQSQYRQTLLGYFWAIMPPLVTTLVWVGLQSFKVVSFLCRARCALRGVRPHGHDPLADVFEQFE